MWGFRPKLTYTCPESANIRPDSTEFGPTSTTMRPISTKHGQDSTNLGSTSVKSDLKLPKSGPKVETLGPNWLGKGQLRPTPDRFGPKSANRGSTKLLPERLLSDVMHRRPIMASPLAGPASSSAGPRHFGWTSAFEAQVMVLLAQTVATRTVLGVPSRSGPSRSGTSRSGPRRFGPSSARHAWEL